MFFMNKQIKIHDKKLDSHKGSHISFYYVLQTLIFLVYSQLFDFFGRWLRLETLFIFCNIYFGMKLEKTFSATLNFFFTKRINKCLLSASIGKPAEQLLPLMTQRPKKIFDSKYTKQIILRREIALINLNTFDVILI